MVIRCLKKALGVALEDGLKKLDKGEFNRCLDQSGAYSIQFGNKLKQYMVQVSAAPRKAGDKKVITTKDW